MSVCVTDRRRGNAGARKLSGTGTPDRRGSEATITYDRDTPTGEVSGVSCRFILLTNNPRYKDRSDLPVEYHDGVSGREIITGGRDLIHVGWQLLNHPLYGNFRPRQQPYRTLLLRRDEKSHVFDDYGLKLIEEAERVYHAEEALTPAHTPERMRRDCSEIDFELMRETLSRYGFIH